VGGACSVLLRWRSGDSCLLHLGGCLRLDTGSFLSLLLLATAL